MGPEKQAVFRNCIYTPGIRNESSRMKAKIQGRNSWVLEGGGHACRREGEGHASPCLLDLEISISTCLLAYFAAAQLFEEM